MSQPEKSHPPTCTGQCEHCELVEPEADPDVMGWRMVLASALVFILPLLLAAAGAFLTRQNQSRQLGGALMGAIAGVLLARFVTARMRPSKKA